MYIYIYIETTCFYAIIRSEGQRHDLPGGVVDGAGHGRGLAERYKVLTDRRRLNGYLAARVPSPPGKHTFKNFTI